jgi:DNA-binding NarL/FixJ family response regulator
VSAGRASDQDVEDPRGRVAIVDPDASARRELRDALQEEGFVVVGGAADTREAIKLISYYRPEIAVLELDYPGAGGVELIRRIAAEMPAVRILVYSSADAEESQLKAFRAGADGFVSKRIDSRGLASAAKGVLRGEAAVSRGLAMSLVERLRSLPESGTGMRPVKSKLTPREWEVVDLISQGLNTKQMAAELVLSEETVYTHVKHLLRKLDVHTRKEAVEATNRMREPGGDIES